MARIVFVVCAALLVSSTVLAQRTWRVNCHNPAGTDFTDIPPAVAAAAPGDTILVVNDGGPSCSTGGYNAPTIDKPLTVIGCATFGTPGGGIAPQHSVMDGLLTIRRIPAGSRVVVAQLLLHPRFDNTDPHRPSVFPHGIVIEDCAGEVVLESCRYNSRGLIHSSFRIARCARVVLRGSTVLMAGTALEVFDSELFVSRCLVAKQWPFTLPTFTPLGYQTNTETLRIRNSTVSLINSTLEGASALAVPWQPSEAPTPGAVLESGSLRIGPVSLVSGGFDSMRFVESYAMTPNSTGQVYFDDRGTMTPQAAGSRPPIPTLMHATFASLIAQSEFYEVMTFGPRGGFAVLCAGSFVGSAQPTPLGALHLDPNGLLVTGLFPLSTATGQSAILRQLCSRFLPVGHVFAFQAAVLDPNGTISLAAPSPFTVGWEHGRPAY